LAVPVGRTAAGNRPARGLLRPAAIVAAAAGGAAAGPRDPVAAALAALSADVLLRPRQADERRPDLARPDGDAVPLRDAAAAAPFRSVNFYGLFAVMTTKRPEIVIEGSDDGKTWLPYEFKWKPGDVNRRPAFTWFHMPRLDWQMWFAALGDWQQNLWVLAFM